MPITVLVVDDEKDIVELVCYHLEKAGVRCLQAADRERVGAGDDRTVYLAAGLMASPRLLFPDP